MKTLRVTLVLITAFASSFAFAGPRGKSTPPPAGSAAYRSYSAESGETTPRMFKKFGKRTTSEACTKETVKCKAHCEK
ncbi:MAG: hypothetical protein ABII82_01105 [Verrucomicrobiota bacterium]